MNDRAVLVTGAASGIGRATALMLARRGARLALADRNVAGAEDVRAAIAATDGSAIAIEVEIGDATSVDRMVEKTLSSFGQLDVLVHCAGILKIAPVVDMSNADWNRVVGINLTGSLYAARAAARAMIPRKSGRIILITSGLGTTGAPSNAAYAASKGGVNALMFSLAREMRPYGIAVNALNPGQTDTPMMRSLPANMLTTSMEDDLAKGIGKPENTAEAILFLATNEHGISGQIMNVRMMT